MLLLIPTRKSNLSHFILKIFRQYIFWKQCRPLYLVFPIYIIHEIFRYSRFIDSLVKLWSSLIQLGDLLFINAGILLHFFNHVIAIFVFVQADVLFLAELSHHIKFDLFFWNVDEARIWREAQAFDGSFLRFSFQNGDWRNHDSWLIHRVHGFFFVYSLKVSVLIKVRLVHLLKNLF